MDKDELFAGMNKLVEDHPWAFDEACRIVQGIEPDGMVTYRLAAGRKVQLTIEVSEALVKAQAMTAEDVKKKNAEARAKLTRR